MKTVLIVCILLTNVRIQSPQIPRPVPTVSKRQNPTTQKPEAPTPSSQAISQHVETKESAAAKWARDWREAAAPLTWPSWALVAVGLFGVIAALCTLRTIRDQTAHVARQALSMRRQTILLRISADAAKESADATRQSVDLVINKERARLKIDLKLLDLTRRYSSAYLVDFTVRCYGTSAAYIVETSCAAYVAPLAIIDDEEMASAVMLPISAFPNFPNVISPGSPGVDAFAVLDLAEDTLLGEVKLDRLFVGIRGYIKYKDVFDISREIKFRHVWKFSVFSPQDEANRIGTWQKCGTNEENSET